MLTCPFHHFTARIASNVLLSSRGPTCRSLSTHTLQISDKYNSVGDLIGIACVYQAATFVDTLITPEFLNLPNPYLYTAARVALWTLYGFIAGLFGTGLWVIAHECGHQAFSESKFINNLVGWVLHSS